MGTHNEHAVGASVMPLREVIRELFRFRTVRFTYLASGLQMFVQGSIVVWMPSYLNRFHGLDPADSAVRAGVLVLVAGVGMTLGGGVVDRLSVGQPKNRLVIPALGTVASGIILMGVFLLPSGLSQFTLLGFGLLLGIGFADPAGAVVADVTYPAIRATVLATLTLAKNLPGLAPGPFLTGVLADVAGLDVAMRIVPLVALASATCFFLASRSSVAERVHNQVPHEQR